MKDEKFEINVRARALKKKRSFTRIRKSPTMQIGEQITVTDKFQTDLGYLNFSPSHRILLISARSLEQLEREIKGRYKANLFFPPSKRMPR